MFCITIGYELMTQLYNKNFLLLIYNMQLSSYVNVWEGLGCKYVVIIIKR